jgi:hypothetical protein
MRVKCLQNPTEKRTTFKNVNVNQPVSIIIILPLHLETIPYYISVLVRRSIKAADILTEKSGV